MGRCKHKSMAGVAARLSGHQSGSVFFRFLFGLEVEVVAKAEHYVGCLLYTSDAADD